MKKYFFNILLSVQILIFLCTPLLLISCSDRNPVASNNTGLSENIKNITYYTENYPPFNYEENGNLYGVSIDILDQLFIKMNVNINRQKVVMSDWSAAYQTTLGSANTMLFSTVRNAERENLFKWVGPIAPQKDVLISLSNANVTINSTSDLINYKIGVIKDYSSIQLLVGFGISQDKLILAENVDDLYSKLQSGAVDCIAYSEIGHNLVISGMSLNQSDFKISFVMKVNELYYAFNINTSNDIITYFQNALNDLKDDKTTDGSSVYDKIISNYNIINHSDDGITNEQVITLVNTTSVNIGSDAPGTFVKINNSEQPYRDANFPALYAFVYDTSLTIVAHATNSLLVGSNFKGKPDVAGKLFRDEILTGALTNGIGWEDYIYTKPGEGGLYYKTTYYKLTTGSNGKLYIVCAGKYK